MKNSILIFERLQSGHREAYVGYLSKLITGATPLFGLSIRNIWRLIRADKVVFSTADDYLIFYILLSFIRKLLKKNSLGILIRAEICLDRGDWKRILKKRLLKLQLLLGIGKSVSIMPFFVEPRLESYVSNWIYDPAFFARNETSYVPVVDAEAVFVEKVNNEKTQGKCLVVFLGALSNERGIYQFLRLAVDMAEECPEMTFVACGANTENLNKSEINEFQRVGGLILPARVSEDSFDTLVRIADCVWCVFGSQYDQFSGIFCNAVRNGSAILLRRESRLHRFASLFSEQEPKEENQLLKSLDGVQRVLIINSNLDFNSAERHNHTVICKNIDE